MWVSRLIHLSPVYNWREVNKLPIQVTALSRKQERKIVWEKGRGGGKESGVAHTRGVRGIYRLWLQHGMKLYLLLGGSMMMKIPQEVVFSHIQTATTPGVSNG